MNCITEEGPNTTPPQTMRGINNSLEGTAVKATVWLKCILLAPKLLLLKHENGLASMNAFLII